MSNKNNVVSLYEDIKIEIQDPLTLRESDILDKAKELSILEKNLDIRKKKIQEKVKALIKARELDKKEKQEYFDGVNAKLEQEKALLGEAIKASKEGFSHLSLVYYVGFSLFAGLGLGGYASLLIFNYQG